MSSRAKVFYPTLSQLKTKPCARQPHAHHFPPPYGARATCPQKNAQRFNVLIIHTSCYNFDHKQNLWKLLK
jgi:hypothetical protein